MEPAFIAAGNPANVLTKQDVMALLELTNRAPIQGNEARGVALLQAKLQQALQPQEEPTEA